MSDTIDVWADRRVKIGYETAEELAKHAHELNWRGHPEGQATATNEALDSLGWIDEIKVNVNTGNVFNGHLRISLALAKDPTMPLPVDYYDLTPDEELLALQVLDATTEMAEPIADKLAALLDRTRHLTADKPGLAGMLAALKERAGVNGNGKTPPEPEIPTETEADKLARQYGVKVGQVWQLGRHKIACVDSTDEATVKELIGENRAGMVWADPPYGMGLDTSISKLARPKGEWVNKPKNYPTIANDDRVFDYSPFLWIDCVEQFWWGADFYTDSLPDFGRSGSWIVWDKREDEVMDYAKGSMFELCWSKNPHKREIIRIKWVGLIGTESQDIRTRIHPAQKPLQLPERIFTQHSKPEALIFDPFLGSGISILAAEKLNDGRRVIGCELAPEYIAVTIYRWQQMTQQQPRLVSG